MRDIEKLFKGNAKDINLTANLPDIADVWIELMDKPTFVRIITDLLKSNLLQITSNTIQCIKKGGMKIELQKNTQTKLNIVKNGLAKK